VSEERTLVLVKPDGVQRGLVGAVMTRFERKGLHIVGLKLLRVDRVLAERHYAEHQGKPFYASLIEYITSSPVVAMVCEGPGAVALVRSMMGATNPANAQPGTIRGDYALHMNNNMVHGSDSVQRAAEEVALFFAPDELVEWSSDVSRWVTG
jgi:nucleoside-diphosphate kinase